MEQKNTIELSHRYLFIDNLRVFLTMLVIVHHVAVAYGGTGGWTIKETPTDEISPILLTVLNGINQSFFMSLFFFVAGYFVPPSLNRKGLIPFLKDRFVKFVIPFVMYLFIFFPINIYLIVNYKHNRSESLLTCFTNQFTDFTFASGHLWFLLALMVYTLLYIFVKKGINRLTDSVSYPSNKIIIFLIVIMTIGTGIVRIFFPVGYSTFGIQWAHQFHYVIFFFLGTIFYEKEWLHQLLHSNNTLWRTTALSSIISMPILMVISGALKDGPDVFLGGLHWQMIEYVLWESIACVSISITLVVFFYKKCNRQNRFLKHLASLSFTVYIIHQTVITAIQIPLLSMSIASLLKFFMVTIIGISLCYIVAYIIKYFTESFRLIQH